jgi:hypothetical protein
MEEINDKYLTTHQAAALLNVPTRTLEGWRYRGVGPRYLKYSRSTCRYRLSDLLDFLEKAQRLPQRGDRL